MRTALAVQVAAILTLLAAASTPVEAEGIPVGLTPDGWAQIQGAQAGLPHARSVSSVPFGHEAQLFGHSGKDAGQRAGFSVAVSGDTAVLGVPTDDTPAGLSTGSAFVFVRSGTTWTFQQRLTASDGATWDQFGQSIALSGDTVVIGQTPASISQGAAYVFVRSGTVWTQQQKLTASDAPTDHSFGSSVSVSQDTVVVGAPNLQSTGSAYVFVRSGTAWSEQQKLTASDAASNDGLGTSVSIVQDTVAVSAPNDDTPAGMNTGSAYVFVRSGTVWTQQQKLTASDASLGDSLGSSISLSQDTVAVGATAAGNFAGCAYVFVRSGTVWSEQQKLTASDGAPNDSFGSAVSLSADTVAVGAGAAGLSTGSAYVFVRSGTTWTEEQKLTASDAASNDLFGLSVSLSGDTALIGSPFHDTPGGVDAGSAYAFVRSGTAWTEEQELVSDAAPGANFGASVSASTLPFGMTVALGAPLTDQPGAGDAGSASLFVRSGTTWSEQQQIGASDAAAGDSFGVSVSLHADTLVVGAPFDDTPRGADAGSAHVFVRTGSTWTLQQKLTASDAAPGDSFGRSVAVWGDTVVVGAFQGDGPAGANAGAAYVFVRSGVTWSEEQKLTASDAAADDHFGVSASAFSDTVVIGALQDAQAGPGPGAAYVFVRSGTTWSEQQKLTASDGAQNDLFGRSVSLSVDTIVAGASGHDAASGADAGSAYVFVRSGTSWSEQQKLSASDEAAEGLFGSSVSVLGDRLVVGAPGTGTQPPGLHPGSAYVFERVGTTWAETQKLSAPDATTDDDFGAATAITLDTIVVGAPFDDTPDALDAGSAHVFREPRADLSVTKTDIQGTAIPGQPITYGVVAFNGGPLPVLNATLTDIMPAALIDVTWQCTWPLGCSLNGTGDINQVISLGVFASVDFTITATVDPAATGLLANTATISVPPGIEDPFPINNSATDTDTLTPVMDVHVVKTDGQIAAVPGQPLTYTITAGNAGPSATDGPRITDTVPAALLGATWSCAASPGSSCTASGSGSIDDTTTIAVGGTLVYTLTGTVDPAATLEIVNSATIQPPAGAGDPDRANSTSTDIDALPAGFPTDGELAHGYDRWHDLAALPGPVPDEDLFRIYQHSHASYEVVLDGASGDVHSPLGSGPLLERLASDASSLIQFSSPLGTGGSRSLRWMNAQDQPVVDQFVRVRSAGCSTDCDAADVYHLTVRETTGLISRFNNSESQVTILVLENPGDETLDVDIRLWSPSGAHLGGAGVPLDPHETYVLDTAAIAPGSSGSITVANTGRYGQLSGKVVAVEPATGFTFDTALETRAR